MTAFGVALNDTTRRASIARKDGRLLGVTRLELAALGVDPERSPFGWLLHGVPFIVMDQPPPCPCCGHKPDA